MPAPTPPKLPADDDLEACAAVDLNHLFAQMMAARRSSPILPPSTYAELRSLLPSDLPREGEELKDALAEIMSVLRFHRRNAHEGFFGYICGPGLPSDSVAALISSALNQNVTGYSSAPGATTIERTLIEWLCQLAGLPSGAGGLLVSGGSTANLNAITTALHRAAGPDLRRKGLGSLEGGGSFRLYHAPSAHFSVQRGAIAAGLGSDSLRPIAVDSERRMIPEALSSAIAEDRHQGLRPFCVVATAGTTTTGAIDPLDAIGAVAGDAGIWFHVDAAFGAAALLSEELRPRLQGIARADSITVDLHKGFYTGLDASALLLRDPKAARQLYYASADYVDLPEEGCDEEFAFFHLGLETSRRFRALAPYLALRMIGAERMGRNALHAVQCVEFLAASAREDPELEVVAWPQLSICCFRFIGTGLSPERIDEINARIPRALLAEGDFYLSATQVDGRPLLRVCLASYATRAEHISALLDRVKAIGKRG